MQNIKTEKIDTFKNIPSDNNQYSYEFIENNQALVLDITDDEITIGITDKTSNDIISTIIGFHLQTVNFVKISQVELTSWLSKKLGETDNGIIQPSNTDDNKTLIDKMANDAPTINLVNSICIDA